MAHTYGTSARLPATATTTTANPATFSINCPAGTTVLWLGIVVSGTTARSGGDPTYDSVAMTAGAAKTNAGGTAEENAETWYMLLPPTGSSLTISVPNSGGLALTMSAACASAANGYISSKSGSSVATQGNSTNPSTTGPAGAVGDITFAVIGNGAQAWAPSARSGTQIHDWDSGSRGHGSQYVIEAGTSGSTLSWTFGTSEDWIIEADRFTETAIVAPTVTSSDPTNVGQTTCTGNGNVTADGGGTITERGVCWGTASNPTTANSKATAAGTTGAYTADVTGLTPNTLYHFRAYAINSAGTSYGADVTATTDPYDQGWGFLPSIALVLDAAVASATVDNAASATETSTPAGTIDYAGTVQAATSATTLSEPAGVADGAGVVAPAASATQLSEPAATLDYAGTVDNAASATSASTPAIAQQVTTEMAPAWLPSIGLLLSPISNLWSATALSSPTGVQIFTQAQPDNLTSATAAATVAGTLTGNGQVTLTWTASSDPSVTGYYLYWDTVSRGDSSYLLYANSRDVGNVTSYTLTGLTAGITYYLNLSAHGAGGHDAYESGLVGEVSQVAILPTAVLSNAASATALTTPATTQLQRASVAAATSATAAAQPAGTLALVGTVDAATSATLAANVLGVHSQFGAVAAAASATLAATPAAAMTYVGQPQAALSAVTASAPLGRQVHAGAIAAAESATLLDATASVQLNRGTAANLASATTVDAVSGTQPGFGAIVAAASATLLDTTASTQDQQGAPADAASAAAVDTIAGAVVNVATVDSPSSATAAGTPTGVQIHESAVAVPASATQADSPTGTVGYTGVVPSIASATAASAPEGTQDQTTTVSDATTATALTEPAGVNVTVGTVAGATSDTELWEPDCLQIHSALPADALSAIGAADILGTQDHVGIVVGVESRGTLGLPSFVDDIASATSMATTYGAQISSVNTLVPRNARSRTYVRRPYICPRDAA
jgi:hypothetical protein